MLTYAESFLWQPVFGGETYIGMPDRDSAVSSIRVMQRFYSFGGDTFSAAVEYLDRFLSKVKVTI